jgi:tRNA (guanine37-N1)-methyltransferase
MRPRSLRQIQEDMLPKRLHKFIFKAFDQMGDIAILDVPKELARYEKKIAQVLLKEHKVVNTVCKKTGVRGGLFRRQPLKILAGKRTYETIHKEYNTRLMLHIRDVYFSPRMCTERKRIADQVKKGEDILVMFSGCSSFACVIARNSEPKSVSSVEINPIAHKYAKLNEKLNKLDNLGSFCGDVRKEVPKLKKRFDRVVMAAPFHAEQFFDVAIKAAKKGATVHYYDFAKEDEFNIIKDKVRSAVKQQKRECRILKLTKCGTNAPGSYRVVVDFKMLD